MLARRSVRRARRVAQVRARLIGYLWCAGVTTTYCAGGSCGSNSKLTTSMFLGDGWERVFHPNDLMLRAHA